MSDEVWSRREVQSPCVKLCSIHPAERLCVGCLRTMDEIAGWNLMSNDERAAVLDALPERAPRIRKRRGGRARPANGTGGEGARLPSPAPAVADLPQGTGPKV